MRPFIDLNPFAADDTFTWQHIKDSDGMAYVVQLIGYDRPTQLMLTELLLWDFWNFMQSNGRENEPVVVVLDEAQNLNHQSSSPIGKILTEGRKFGISGWYATQFMKGQLNTGKSHLAVTLAALFSGHDNTLRQIALSRIESADTEIAKQFYHYTGKNLVLIYNGMSNFNLDSETLRLAKLALVQHGMDSSVLMELTQQYEQGRSFVERTFERFANEYHDAFPEQNEQERKEFILCHIEERDVFQKVNELYFTVNGSYTQQDKGISAGDILELLQLLIDEEGILLDLLRTRKTINAFSESEQARFARFIRPVRKPQRLC